MVLRGDVSSTETIPKAAHAYTRKKYEVYSPWQNNQAVLGPFASYTSLNTTSESTAKSVIQSKFRTWISGKGYSVTTSGSTDYIETSVGSEHHRYILYSSDSNHRYKFECAYHLSWQNGVYTSGASWVQIYRLTCDKCGAYN